MRCIPWYGDLGERWLLGRDMTETVVLHMLQRCLPYVEELTSWTKDETDIDVDLGAWLPGWYVVEDDNDFRWRRM